MANVVYNLPKVGVVLETQPQEVKEEEFEAENVVQPYDIFRIFINASITPHFIETVIGSLDLQYSISGKLETVSIRPR